MQCSSDLDYGARDVHIYNIIQKLYKINTCTVSVYFFFLFFFTCTHKNIYSHTHTIQS